MKVRYVCQRCTNCCRWPGLVRISDREISAIARFLQCSEYEFVQRFTRLRPQRDGLALEEKIDGSCVFLEGKNCGIQPVKPDQCAGFPNSWNFPGWREVCEAIPVVEIGESAKGRWGEWAKGRSGHIVPRSVGRKSRRAADVFSSADFPRRI